MGVLEAADSSTLFLTPRGRPGVLLRYADIESIAIARGRESRPGGAAAGAKRGFLIGATVGLVATAVALSYDMNASGESFIPASVIIGGFGIALTAVSTGVGAAIGATPRTRWERVWPR